MTRQIFKKWIISWNNQLQGKNWKISLLFYSFKGHDLPSEGLSNIKLIFFQPNLTPYIQTLDSGIIQAFKAQYHKRFLSLAIWYYNSNVNINQIYNFDQLSEMCLSHLAWNSITQEKIINFWDHTKIIPKLTPIPDDFALAMEETSLTEEGNCLQDLGLITSHKQTSIMELLNPVKENESNFLLTAEIFDENQPTNQELEENTLNKPVLPLPSLAEVHLAISLVLTYAYFELIKEADNVSENLYSYLRGVKLKIFKS
ncbi:hypothetical protein O181_107022 [Austropuccinia psidii MF-1]|uniref:DDE-1 domain-containing protein n=1 Tax=Austropuccinia psidii MF-1 TaxID=1389203 RepID=A0A9Q3PNY4_9BASI|nr:hypothetical protein [Austropuccinia psidii MF-1]